MSLNVISIEDAEEIMAAGLEDAIDEVHSFHRDTARRIWPRGAVLQCPVCGHEQTATTIELATHLGRGWPTCHGETMRVGDAVISGQEAESDGEIA